MSLAPARSAARRRDDTIVIGYGSLMSGRGLAGLGRTRVRGAWRVAIDNARRGFGKYAQRGDHYAMVLEPIDPRQMLRVRRLAPEATAASGIEALALAVPPQALERLCDREGYPTAAMHQLRIAATRQGHGDVARCLGELLASADGDIAGYRRRLRDLTGETSPHYIPHPVQTDVDGWALTFLAPGVEGTGDAGVVAVRVRTRMHDLLALEQAWCRKGNPTQASYFASCLLGGIHGIAQHDLVGELVDGELLTRLRSDLSHHWPAETATFLRATSLDPHAYWDSFGSPRRAFRRGGLARLLGVT